MICIAIWVIVLFPFHSWIVWLVLVWAPWSTSWMNYGGICKSRYVFAVLFIPLSSATSYCSRLDFQSIFRTRCLNCFGWLVWLGWNWYYWNDVPVEGLGLGVFCCPVFQSDNGCACCRRMSLKQSGTRKWMTSWLQQSKWSSKCSLSIWHSIPQWLMS